MRTTWRAALAALSVAGVLGASVGAAPAGAAAPLWFDDAASARVSVTGSAFVDGHVPMRTGRIINEYTWGGYLSWRLSPRFQVLLDGRTHVYPPEFWRTVYGSGDEEL